MRLEYSRSSDSLRFHHLVVYVRRINLREENLTLSYNLRAPFIHRGGKGMASDREGMKTQIGGQAIILYPQSGIRCKQEVGLAYK